VAIGNFKHFQTRQGCDELARRILVTGSTGLLGSQLLEIPQVIEYFVPPRFDLLGEGAAKKLSEIADFNECDGILNLAWVSNSQNDYSNSSLNFSWLSFSRDLAEVCIDKKIQYIGAGTCLEKIVSDKSNYVESKRTHFSEISSYLTNSNMLWLRFAYIVDLINMKPRILNQFKDMDSTQLIIKQPNCKNDYILIGDAVNAINWSISHGLSGVVEIGSGKLHSNRSLIEKFCTSREYRTPNFIQAELAEDGPVSDIEVLKNSGWTPSETLAFFDNG
jgi:hypothetical protein